MAGNIQQIEERIKKAFFNDLFAMFQDVPQGRMTAYEVAQKVGRKIESNFSYGRGISESESLKPRLKRIFAIMKRKGLISPLPDSLKGLGIIC